MDLVSMFVSLGWSAGINAYGTVALLGLAGRIGVDTVPEQLTSWPVIAIAGVLYLIEFVADKVPFVDSTWDIIHTLIRPAVASFIGFSIGGDPLDGGGVGTEQLFGAITSGATAFASHTIKASLRLVVNTSPEPFSNIAISLFEDGLVGGMVLLAISYPEIALIIAVCFLIIGALMVYFMFSLIKRAWQKYKDYRSGARPASTDPPLDIKKL